MNQRCLMCGREHNGTYGSRCEDCYAICQDYPRLCEATSVAWAKVWRRCPQETFTPAEYAEAKSGFAEVFALGFEAGAHAALDRVRELQCVGGKPDAIECFCDLCGSLMSEERCGCGLHCSENCCDFRSE